MPSPGVDPMQAAAELCGPPSTGSTQYPGRAPPSVMAQFASPSTPRPSEKSTENPALQPGQKPSLALFSPETPGSPLGRPPEPEGKVSVWEMNLHEEPGVL